MPAGNATTTVLRVLDDVLGLDGRATAFTADTRLLGAIAELDSLAVAAILGRLEEDFGIEIADDEIDAAIFESVGSVTAFVTAKLR